MNRNPIFPNEVRTLYHYTNKEGYDAILASQLMIPSTIEGVKHTRHGKGVYFTLENPMEIDNMGHYKGLELVFERVTTDAVGRMTHWIEFDVPAEWAIELCSTSNYSMWVLIGEETRNVAGRIADHGVTIIGSILASCHITPRDYAYQLRQEHAAQKRPKQFVRDTNVDPLDGAGNEPWQEMTPWFDWESMMSSSH